MKAKEIDFWSTVNYYGDVNRSDPRKGAHISVVLPLGELNPGNKIDPTNWAYDIKIDRFFTGQMHYISSPNNGSTGSIYTGNGTVAEATAWARSRLYNRALERLNEKVHSSADWSEDLAHASQLKSLGNLCKTAEDLAKEGKKSGSKALASAFLQGKYGWLPLLGNIFDTATAIAQPVVNNGITIRAGASERIRVDKYIPNLWIYAPNGVKHFENGKMGCRFQVTMKGLKGPSFSDFTTLNPLYLAWNLLPYSFVVDWFYNVGGYMEAFEKSLKNNANFRSGFYTELYSNRIKEIALNAKWLANDTIVDYARGRQKLVYFRRTVLTSYPLPRLPTLEVDLGSSRLLAAAALLRSILK